MLPAGDHRLEFETAKRSVGRPARALHLLAAALGSLTVLVAASCEQGSPGAIASPSGTSPPGTSSQPPASTPVESDGGVPGRCGRERWAVKTGTDGTASSIDAASVTDTTVTALRALGAPSESTLSMHGFDRIAPVELTVYRVRATLTGYKREADSDYHLVIADASGQTMIAEVPSPSCVGATSPFRPAIAAARRAVDRQFPGAERQTTFQATSRPVTVTGVGFFDFLHGQAGVAPNGIELHPVLALDFAAP